MGLSDDARQTAAEHRLRRAAETFPMGREVYYTPVSGGPAESTPRRVRSAPWELGHGAIVIALEGKSGGVLIEHLSLTP